MQRSGFKSNEEFFFYNWLLEGQENGLIKDIVYQPEPYLLACRASMFYSKKIPTKKLPTRTKLVEKFLYAKHKYTADFKFRLEAPLNKYFIHSSYFGRDEIIVDTKGKHSKYGGSTIFSINQKWVYANHGIYVEKIVPDKFFKKTWCPEICRYTLARKDPVKKFIGVPTVQEFIKNVK